MASLPKELRSRKAHMHLTTPAGHAAGASPESAESEAKEQKQDLNEMNKNFLNHPQIQDDKPIHQKKLINDTAYFLHHPQIPPHGPKMPPANARENKGSK